jgi:hypothetical protein
MATQLKLADVEAGIIGALKAGIPDADVLSITRRQIDSEGNIVLNSSRPTVLVVLEGGGYIPLGDNQRISYGAELRWLALCFDQNLRSDADERAESYALVSKVVNAIAGQRIANGSDDRTEPAFVTGIEPFQLDDNGSWYAVRFSVGDTAQFSAKI